MPDNSLSGKVGLDVTDFKSGISELSRNIRVVESGFQAVAAGLGDWSKSASGLELRIKALNGEIDLQKSKVAALAAEHARIVASQGEGSKAAQDLEIRLNKETATLGRMESELGTTQTSLSGMSSKSGEAAKETDNLGKKEEETTGHTSKFSGALEGLKAKLSAGVSGLKDMAVNVAKVGVGLAVGLVGATVGVGAAIGAAIMKTGAWADRFATLSGQTGISTKRLQELDYIGKKLDVDLETITGSMSKMIRNMASAEKGTGAAADAFKSLGVKVIDTNGNLRDSTTVYGEAITALGKVGNETERDALAMAIFGKSALELNPLITAGKDKLKELADEANRTGAVMSTDAVEAFDKFKDSVDALGNSAKGIIGTLLAGLMPTLNQVVAWIQSTLIPWLQVNLPVAIQFLTNAWTTVLLPAIQSVWTWMSTVLIPFLQTVVFPWLQVNLPAAIQILSDFWNNILLPALTNVWNYLVVNIIPKLSDVWTWLQTNIPAAIQTASDFWNNTLQPALNNVWTFIVNNVVPIFNTVWNWLQIEIPNAVKTVSDFWNNTLQPALNTVWSFIVNNVVPGFFTLWNQLSTDVYNASQKVSDFWNGPLKTALTGVTDYVNGSVIPAITTLSQVKIPEWQQKNTDLTQKIVNFLSPALVDLWDILNTRIIPIINTLNTIYLEANILKVELGVLAWDKLKKIFTDIYLYVAGTFGPILKDISDFLDQHLNPAVGNINGTFKNLADSLSGIVKSGLAIVLQLLKDIAAALANIVIPKDWKGDSPSPFETWLVGIGDAMRALSATELPALRVGLQGIGGVGAGYGQPVVNNSWNYVIQAANPLQTSDDLARQVRLLELMHG